MVHTAVSGAGRLVAEALRDLQTTFQGDVIRPSDERYNTLRTLWNGRYDRHPALILRPPATYQRLQAIKQQYDPQNIFCSNQNIPPASN